MKFPVPAFAAAPKTTETLAPAAIANGLAGFEVIPAGSVPSETCTVPLKPFSGATLNWIGELVAPCVTLTEFEEEVRVKSGDGGGGGGCVTAEAPPPHAQQ